MEWSPGQAVRALAGFCFHPDKMVTKEGKSYKISELQLNSTQKNGAIVQSNETFKCKRRW